MSETPAEIQPRSSKSFLEHLKATLVLGLPLVAAQLTQMLVGVTDTIMLGWLGTKELAAGTLAFQLFFIFLIFGLGFGAAMVPLIANALGRNDPTAVRRASRMGLWALSGLAFLFMLPLWFTKDILIGFGQNPELAQLAQDYMRIAQWSMIPAFVLIGLRSLLTGLEKANMVLWITLFMAILNGLLNYAFIFGNWGAPRLEMEGAAVATLIANLVAGVASIIYVAQSSVAQPYNIFQRLWKPDWSALNSVSRLGVPISLSIFAEAGMFSAASLMIGWLGKVPLAAHGIALQIASLAFMVPLGLTQGGAVRIGNAAGRNDKHAVGMAGKALVSICLILSLFSAALFLIVPQSLVELFVEPSNADAQDVIKYGVSLLYMAAAFQIFDSLQAASGGNLRGLQDTKIPLVIATISYWVVGMGSAYLLAFHLGFGGVGVWAGLVIGLAVASVGLTYRFSRREYYGLI